MAKILLIIAILLSLGAAGVGYMNSQEKKGLQADLASVETSLGGTKSELEQARKEIETLQVGTESAKSDKAKVESDLASARAEAQKTQSELAEVNAAADEVRGQLAALTAQIEEKDATIAQLSEAVSSAPAIAETQVDDTRVQELEALVESLNSKVASTESELTQLRQREQDRQAQRMREGLQGRVLAVNPAWNFVVLDIGDRHGVVNNAELLVKRGSTYLGTVRITSVEPSTSIADIVANSMPMGLSVQPGDRVIYGSSN